VCQTDLQIISKRSKKRKLHLIFMNFGVRNFKVKRNEKKKKKTLMFGHYNLMDCMKLQAITF
jgi:hypothetical protein